jgi:hypothetical protein
MDMKFGIWNVRSLYRACSLMIFVKEISKYKSDLTGVQEVRWDRGGTEPVGEYIFFYGMGNENHELCTGFFLHTRNISAVKKVEFVSDRMPYMALRRRWCDIIILNVHAQQRIKLMILRTVYTRNLNVYSMNSLNMKILLGDFSAKIGRENFSNQHFGMRVYTKI